MYVPILLFSRIVLSFYYYSKPLIEFCLYLSNEHLTVEFNRNLLILRLFGFGVGMLHVIGTATLVRHLHITRITRANLTVATCITTNTALL